MNFSDGRCHQYGSKGGKPCYDYHRVVADAVGSQPVEKPYQWIIVPHNSPPSAHALKSDAVVTKPSLRRMSRTL